ncbi:MAG: hypothetical protein APR54_11280 [Candidatus Cloacimonas sp. SDB]|nr:MAG: hypothetical protein APR54_11280 [Candidatus Cloacimonas sp. SDB]
MNRYIVFLFVVIFILLLAWNLIPFLFQQQKNMYLNEIEESPIVLIIESSTDLDSLSILMDDLNYIDHYVVERDSTISNLLIETYNLERAKNILAKYDLPDIIKIYLDFSQFGLDKYFQLEKLIKTGYPDVIYKYNTRKLLDFETRKNHLLNAFYLINGIVIIFVLLLLTFLRVHFESKQNNYWKIFRESGGHSTYRNRQYWLNSILLCVAPAGIIVGIYYLFQAHGIISGEINFYLFIAQFATLVLASILGRIFMGEKI